MANVLAQVMSIENARPAGGTSITVRLRILVIGPQGSGVEFETEDDITFDLTTPGVASAQSIANIVKSVVAGSGHNAVRVLSPAMNISIPA